MSLDAIEPFLTLGMKEADAGTEQVIVDIPLVGNRNDKGTLFGGSMYSAMLLAGWRLCTLKAQSMGQGGDIYVKDSDVRFLRPIRSDMKAVARLVKPPYETPRGNLAFDVEVDATDQSGDLCGRAQATFRLVSKKTG
jgi:thioesterase domain-containing protein